MKTIEVEQRSEEWLEARQTVITGTRVKAIKPLARAGKTGNQPMELWKLVAEYVSYGVEEESPMKRGTNLENENAEMTIAEYELKNPRLDCGLWQSDDNLLGYSPDGAEDAAEPTWAIECKSLNTAEHIYLIMNDLFAKGQLPDGLEPLFAQRPGIYRGIDSVAEEHRHQVRQAFVVNPKLKTLYYSLYDPRVVIPKFKHYVIEVKREEIEDDIAEQKAMVQSQAELAKAIAIALAEAGKEK